VGDYRAIYKVLHEERVLTIHAIGHRSEIYRKK
jgi:mRNA-degrading endonuclease RelE of RelBE toxin-antitoxin system